MENNCMLQFRNKDEEYTKYNSVLNKLFPPSGVVVTPLIGEEKQIETFFTNLKTDITDMFTGEYKMTFSY